MVVDHGKNPKVSLLKYFGTDIIDMELVYPNGNTIVSVNSRNELQVWNKEDGSLVGKVVTKPVFCKNYKTLDEFFKLISLLFCSWVFIIYEMQL